MLRCGSKPTKTNTPLSKETAVIVASRRADAIVAKHNKEYPKEQFDRSRYKTQIKSISNDGVDYWFVYFFYEYPPDAETMITGHPEHFTIRLEKKTGKSFLMHGE